MVNDMPTSETTRIESENGPAEDQAGAPDEVTDGEVELAYAEEPAEDDPDEDQADDSLSHSLAGPSASRPSQDLPIYDDPTGSMFSGPVDQLAPTSVAALLSDPRSDPRSYRSSWSHKSRHSVRSISQSATNHRGQSVGAQSSSSRLSGPRSKSQHDDNKSDAGLSFSSSRHRASSAKRRTRDLSPVIPADQAQVGFFSNLSAIFKGKGRSHSRDSRGSPSHNNYQPVPASDQHRRRSLSRSIRSGRSSTWRSIKSSKSRLRLATANTCLDNSDAAWPDEADGYNSSSGSSSGSTSTSNSDPSSSDSSIFRRRTQAERSNDSRIEVIPLSATNVMHSTTPTEPLDWTPPNEKPDQGHHLSSQSVYIVEDDLEVRFIGWRAVGWKLILWITGCTLSAGILWMAGRWKSLLKLKCQGVQERFDRASHVVAYTQFSQPQLIPLKTIRFSNPQKLSTLCPTTFRVPPATKDEPVGHAREASQPVSTSNDMSSPPAEEHPPSELLVSEISYVDFRYHRFFLHPIAQNFRMARDWQDPAWSLSLFNMASGLDYQESLYRSQLFSQNIIEVEGKTTFQLLVDEVIHPFYIFQIASIILWSFDNYYYYAVCIALISVISVLTALIEMKKNITRMRELSRFKCAVKVLRGTAWINADSTELVPGDVIDLFEPSLHTFPADLVLLSGDAIVNESMLTGESIPVSKLPLPESSLSLMASLAGDPSPALAKHIVFGGTNIVRIRKASQVGGSKVFPHDDAALAMVVRTGFSTTKGALVRSMLFPRPMDFAFYRDSFRFIGALAMIAGFGFLGSSINFVKMGIGWRTIILRALDLITIVVPPALPATMSIGTSFSISRLRNRGIFCISPTRVNIGGKVNLICFDKTGTLTEEGLDVLGVRTVDRNTGAFSQLYDEIEDVPILGAEDMKTPLMHALATCHGLKAVNGQVIGDPLDLRMFEFTGWSIEEAGETVSSVNPEDGSTSLPASQPPKSSKMIERQAALVQTIVRPPGGTTFEVEDALKSTRFLELGIIRTFDFASELRRMSVLVKKLKSSTIEAYVKGAPEAILDICRKETLPTDYEEFLKDYTRHGYRVIAVAAKSFPKLSWIKAQRLTRSQVECELRFLGFVVFENKLKAGTEPAIQVLQSAHIGTRMCTGDNIRTAISVGRDCGMVQDSARVYLPTFISGSQTVADSKIAWFDIDDESALLDPYTLMPLPPCNAESDTRTLDSVSLLMRSEDYVLAISGDVFRWLMDYGPLETVERMLYKSVIFARMSPDEKQELVEKLQGLDYTVGFCGDGANDCGALKAADVGLSLSEAEASVAAPFTSRQPEITCFIELIKEGRCALVTSFSCFKYMALYSLIQFTTVTLLYSLPSSLGDLQFLYIDLFIIIPVAVTMGRTHPYGRIAAKRPTANLVSKRVLISLIGQVLINSTIQLLVFERARSQEDPGHSLPVKGEELPTSNLKTTTLFLVSIFQYILVAATFSVGAPYRKGIFSNYLLVLCLLILGTFSVYLLFANSGFVFDRLELVQLDHAFRLELLLWVISNIFLSWTFESYATQPIALWVGEQTKMMRKKWHALFGGEGTSRRDRKRYKVVADSMEIL